VGGLALTEGRNTHIRERPCVNEGQGRGSPESEAHLPHESQ
jgi:hypothetical protein